MHKMKKALLAVLVSVSLVGCGDKAQDGNTTQTKVSQSNHAATTFVEGTHYSVMAKPFEIKNDQIIEYFWYGCPHCYTAEPVLKKWSEKTNITIEKRHSMLSEKWVEDARVFYTLREMNLLDVASQDYFDARQDYLTSQSSALQKTLEKHGVDRKAYDQVSHGETVEVIMQINKLVEGKTMAKGTPSFVVAGKYIINMEKMRGWNDVTQLAEYLVKKG